MAKAFVSGYSGTPLEKKLGIRESFRIRLINAPKKYFELFTDWPHNIQIIEDAGVKKNFIHFFTKDEAEFYFLLPVLKSEIEMNGMIWVSWPKKTSKMSSVIAEKIRKNAAVKGGLVVKICSFVDD